MLKPKHLLFVMSRRLMRFALGHGGHNAGHDSEDSAEPHSEHSPESHSGHPAAATESEMTNADSSGHYQALDPTSRTGTQSVYARLADE